MILTVNGELRENAPDNLAALWRKETEHLNLEGPKGYAIALNGALVRKVQAVLVHEHRLLAQPLLPRFLAHAFVDALAQLARVRGEVQPFGFMAELDAVDGTGHGKPLVMSLFE